MTVQEIKSNLENNQLPKFPIIFLYSDTRFVAEQYIEKIREISRRDVEYVDPVRNNSVSLFGTQSNEAIRVCFCDELSSTIDADIIVTKKILYDTEYVTIPKLEDIWIKDYLFSQLDGIDIKALEKLFNESKKNIYRLYNEIKKLKGFSKTQKNIVFNEMIDDGQFDDISDKTIFDVSNAILKKDKEELKKLLLKIQSVDCEPLGLVTILYQNFRKYISVWLAKNPTEENTGLKRNVIYAISKQPKVFNKEQLIRSFQFVGEVPHAD